MFSRERWKEEGQIVPYYFGPLSSFPEWHSLAIGYYHGFSENKKIPRAVMLSNGDVSKEPHMAKYGFPLGAMTKYLFFIGIGSAASSPLIAQVIQVCL